MSTNQTTEATTSAYHENNSPATDSFETAAAMPGQVRVIRRNGKLTTYDPSKVQVAMTKAFLAVEGVAPRPPHASTRRSSHWSR